MARSQADQSIRQYSRMPRPVGTLAGERDVLTQFANLRDEDVEKFRAAHPDFFLSQNLTEDGWENGFLMRLGAGGKTVIQAHALQLARALSEGLPNVTLRMRDILRLIWRGEPSANEYLKALLYGSRVEFDWKRGEIVYEPQNEFERALHTLFRKSSLAKICANPDCPAPYFIAKRVTQRYCAPDCAVVFQKEWKRNWWKRVGSARRRQQRAATRKAGKGGKH